MKLLPWLYFIVIQVIAFVSFLLGILVLITFSALRLWKIRESKYYSGRQIEVWYGGWMTYIWGNEEDGVIGAYFYRQEHPNERWCAYLWSAWRNSANNLRFIFRWVGGPFYRWSNGDHYVQFGWYPNGFPVFSTGKVYDVLPKL